MATIAPETRGRYGRVWHLFGDSITLGWALGTFTPPTTHPLYALRSPGSTLEYLFALNGLTDVTRYGGLVIGGPPNGDPGQPCVFVPELVRSLVDHRLIRNGDVVVFEDAGPHGSDPDLYQERLAQLVEIVAGKSVTVLVLTTPDYAPAEPGSQWDRVIEPPEVIEPPVPGRTTNDAVRAVAQTSCAGDVVLLDWDAEMDWRRTAMLNGDGVQSFHSDGIHPNVWGQMVLVRLLLQGGLVWPRITTVSPLADLLAANYQALAYGSTTFTAARARQYVTWLLRE